MERSEPPTTFPTVRVRDVVMNYRSPTTSLKGLSPAARKRAQFRRRLGLQVFTTVRALKGVSFTAYQGEQIGIMGQNGSGKSTLLRIIAGVEPPTSGTVEAVATPSLLSINAALVPALSGSQNIKLGLFAMGMKPHQVKQLIPQIADFAGIGDAIDRPMKTYSSGMGARLRFAIAAAANPQILLLDEALGAGDAAFTEKSERAVEHLRGSAGTIFMVSHAAQEIEKTCTRALWLHNGELLADGPAKQTARKYRWWAWKVAHGEHEIADQLLVDARAEFAEIVAAGAAETLQARRGE